MRVQIYCILFGFLLLFNTSNAQNPGLVYDGYEYLSKSENQRWLQTLKNASSKSAKLELIKDKVSNDARFHVARSESNFWENEINADDNANSDSITNFENCDCKVSIEIYFEYGEFKLDAAKFPFVTEFMDRIDESNIKQIYIDDNFDTQDINTEGQCGKVLLYSENNRLKREITRIMQEDIAER